MAAITMLRRRMLLSIGKRIFAAQEDKKVLSLLTG
jgi:hypothetical protein